jgi:hypothetical protein
MRRIRTVKNAVRDFGCDKYRDTFIEYHKQHPEVMKKFIELSMKLKVAGYKRYGAKAISEVIRHHFNMRKKVKGFKFNNEHTSYYARAVMRLEPKLKGFFELRKSPNQ